MSTGKLSDVQLKAWIKAGEPLARADGEGLTFTLSSRGTASWILRYRFAGMQRELTLGRYPDLALAEARRLARQHRARIQQGEDVTRTRQRAKQASASAWAFARLVENWVLGYLAGFTGTMKMLTMPVCPVCGSRDTAGPGSWRSAV